MKRLLIAFGGLLVLMAGAVLVLPYFIPQAYLQRQLGRLLAQETGLHLERAERLRLSLFPALGIAVEGVSVRLPLETGRAPSFRADRIFTAIAPASLIDRRIRISRIVIENPAMQLRVDAAGRANWNFAGLSLGRGPVRLAALGDSSQVIHTAAVLAAEPVRRRPLPSIDIDIVNGSFGYENEARQRRLGVSSVNLAFRSAGGAGPLRVAGGLRLQGQPVTIDADVAPPGGADRSAPVKLAVTSQAGSTTFDGVVSWSGRPGLSGALRADLRSGEALAQMLGDAGKAAARLGGSALAGRLEISAEEVTLSDAVFSAPGAEGSIAVAAGFDGTAQATIDHFRLHGGTAQGKLTIDARQPQAIMAGSFTMANVDSLALTRGVSGFDWLSGRADVALEIGGGGASLDDLARTLTGKARLMVANGAIEGLDLPRIVADARDGNFKNVRRQDGQRTPFDRLEASFLIEKGVASTSDLKLTGPNVAVSGEGKTDIARGRLSYKVKTKVTALEAAHAPSAEGGAGEQAALTMPLIIKGDWDKPDITPDIESALKDGDSIAGTAKLFGKSVEKLTDGKVKADDFGKAIDQLFGKKKKKKKDAAEDPAAPPAQPQ